jgi:hypothetical protein
MPYAAFATRSGSQARSSSATACTIDCTSYGQPTRYAARFSAAAIDPKAVASKVVRDLAGVAGFSLVAYPKAARIAASRLGEPIHRWL